jgi:hypothetical protein
MAPVSRPTFEAGKITEDASGAILRFLSSHPDEAFALNEILSAVIQESGTSFVLDVVSMLSLKENLDALVEAQKVERGLVTGMEYYAIRRRP